MLQTRLIPKYYLPPPFSLPSQTILTRVIIFGKGLFPVGLSHLGSEEDKEDNNEAKQLGSPIRLHHYILAIFAALHHNLMRIGFAPIVW